VDNNIQGQFIERELNIYYEIKITIPERIGNIYTMADRDQGKRRKQHQRGCDIQC
jgi:hypothetical protein